MVQNNVMMTIALLLTDARMIVLFLLDGFVILLETQLLALMFVGTTPSMPLRDVTMEISLILMDVRVLVQRKQQMGILVLSQLT